MNACTLAGPAERARGDRPTPELVEAWLAEFSVTRDPQLRDRIVLAHLGLAERLAARFHEAPSASHEDLQQTARMGLVAAVNRYDLTRGVPFLSYAVACVVGELKRMLRDSTWRLHVTRRTKDLALRVLPEIDRLQAALRRSPTLAELASRLDATEEQIAEALEAVNSRTVLSLDRPSTGDDDSSLPLADILVTEATDDELVDLLLLPELIEHLPDVERRTVVLYFFDELRQRDIAELLGCSQMQVSRLLTRAIRRLRAMLLLPRPPLGVVPSQFEHMSRYDIDVIVCKEAGMMTVEEATTEWYVMACRRCDRTWQTSCQVRVLHDDAGDRRWYFRDGVPIPAPWSTICPYCGGQRVTLVPHPATDAWTATRA